MSSGSNADIVMAWLRFFCRCVDGQCMCRRRHSVCYGASAWITLVPAEAVDVVDLERRMGNGAGSMVNG